MLYVVDMPKFMEKMMWRFPLDYFKLFYFSRIIVSNLLPGPLLFIFKLYMLFVDALGQ